MYYVFINFIKFISIANKEWDMSIVVTLEHFLTDIFLQVQGV